MISNSGSVTHLSKGFKMPDPSSLCFADIEKFSVPATGFVRKNQPKVDETIKSI